MNRPTKILRTLVVVFAFVATGVILWRWQMALRELRMMRSADPGFGQIQPFTLVDETGKQFSSDQLKGKVWVADFVFTRCMGPCPLISTRASEIQKDFSNQPLDLVSFSVDPDHDTPQDLAKYGAGYGAISGKWHFLTGNRKAMYQVIRDNFHLVVQGLEKDEGVVHSTKFALVDGNGTIRGYYDSDDAVALKKLRADIKTLIRT